MSEIKADALTGKTAAGNVTVTSEGGAVTFQLQQGLAKAWVNFDGTGTVAARDSLNFSGLTDNGAGDYTVTISNAMGNTDYSCGGSSQQNVAGTRGDFVVGLHSTAQTTTTRRLSAVDSGGTATDALVVNLQIFGDLA
jgi:hypothetical protein